MLTVIMMKGKTKCLQKGNEQQCYLVEMNNRTYETVMNNKVSLLEWTPKLCNWDEQDNNIVAENNNLIMMRRNSNAIQLQYI